MARLLQSELSPAGSRSSLRLGFLAGTTLSLVLSGAWLATGAFGSIARVTRAVAHGQPSCKLATSAQVKAVLGLSVGPVKASTPFPGQTKCLYPIGSNALGVQIVFTSESKAAFQQKTKAYAGALTVSGLGDGAFAPSVSTSAGSTSDLFVHKNNTELDLAAIVPLVKLETLAKLILSHL